MRVNVATIIGTEIYSAQTGERVYSPPPSESRAGIASANREVATDIGRDVMEPMPPMNGVEEVVSLLARIAVIARSTTAADQRRINNFVEATRSLLLATTRLPAGEQAAFEAALRNEARRAS